MAPRAHLHHPEGHYVWVLFERSRVEIIHNKGKRADAKGRRWPDTEHLTFTPDAAREFALTILAAAHHAEGTDK